MDPALPVPTEGDAAFVAEVRAFLAEHFDSHLRAMADRQVGIAAEGELQRRWHEALYRKGWVAPAWPVEYGGPGWSWRQRQVFLAECARAGVPSLPSFGLNLCGPVIMKFGTPEQKAFFLPRILSNEHYWCQGYSEPQAGSDLAGLQTQAVADGDDYIVNGSKIWTTYAHFANWIFLLVRTSNQGRPQQGISFIVTPLDAPGVSIRPILSISGAHEVNQVFFDDVRVPRTHLIGEENAGWSVAKYLLEFERGSGALAATLGFALERVKKIARAQPGYADGKSFMDDPAFRRKVAALEIDILAAGGLDERLSLAVSAGQSVGPTGASLKKLISSETGQAISELAMEALGQYGGGDQGAALRDEHQAVIGPGHALTVAARYLNGRANTIYGGSSEIQRNIIAKLALGL